MVCAESAQKKAHTHICAATGVTAHKCAVLKIQIGKKTVSDKYPSSGGNGNAIAALYGYSGIIY